MKNFARKAMVRLLHVVEVLNEFRTGKPCKASVKACFVIGFGYHSEIQENAKVEHYLFPFTRVTIYTWFYSRQSLTDFSND